MELDTCDNLTLKSGSVVFTEALTGIINKTTRDLIETFLIDFISTPVSILGCMANILNLIIFIRQGLKDCISICLFGLAISDFGSVFCGFVSNIILMRAHQEENTKLDPFSLYFFITYGCAMCYDISQAITAFIALERCLCVVLPLKFKNIFSFKPAAVTVLGLYIFNLGAYIPHFLSSGLKSIWNPETNSTRIVLWLSENRDEINLCLNTFVHIIMATIYQIIVVVSTYFMIHGLKNSSKFRLRKLSVTHESNNRVKNYQGEGRKCQEKRPPQIQGHNLSYKNRIVIKMISTLALISIMCNTVRLMAVYAQRFVPDLAFGHRYHNTYDVMNMSLYLFQTLNCSANILVYYNLNPTFRKQFRKVFGFKKE